MGTALTDHLTMRENKEAPIVEWLWGEISALSV
jgi:hypothetical protein